MGSGSSKEKSVKKRAGKDVSVVAKKNTKNVKNDQVINNSSRPTKFQSKNVDEKVLKLQTSPQIKEKPSQKNEKSNDENSNSVVNQSSNGHVKKQTPVKNLGKFESDSESEPEDIADVLAATRAANNQIQEQNFYNTHKETEALPETYAQRLQREQYRHEQQGLLREKTIYRNPEEWNVEEEEKETESFDPSRFKEANIARQAELDRDIFSPVEVPEDNKMTQRYNTTNTDSYNDQTSSQDKRNLPEYDLSEEALLAEIENDF